VNPAQALGKELAVDYHVLGHRQRAQQNQHGAGAIDPLANRRSDTGKHGVRAAGFSGAKVNGDFVAKSPNDSAARGREDAGWMERVAGSFLHSLCL